MKNTTQIRDDILDELLPHVAFDGWAMPDDDRARAVFPGGAADIVDHFADRADREMLAGLSDVDLSSMKIRERIALAVQKRLEWLNQHKEAEQQAVTFWMRPLRKFRGAKIVWRTADVIWHWAGDTASDYNHYTKRALLSGVLVSTTLYWLQATGKDLGPTFAFLDRRIDNVLKSGKTIGGIKNFKKARA